MSFRLVNVGDSVPWGQGLLENEKYDSLLQRALGSLHPEGVSLERFAHSGATITHGNGAVSTSSEVPVARPTITDQINAVPSPDTVDVLLVNGGINDVGVATILNPLALVPPLSTLVRTACYFRMLDVLHYITQRYTKPSCRVLVTNYYLNFEPAK